MGKMSTFLNNRLGQVIRYGLSLLLGAALLVILLQVAQWYARRTAFHDDTFIYLHIAANVVENGTAEFYLPAKSSMLLASSPLRLYIVAAAAYAVAHFHDSLRNLDAARQILIWAGLITNLLFLPFWRKHLQAFLAVSVIYWLLAGSLLTFLEMEGGLVYFSLLTLLYMLIVRENPLLLGVAAGLLSLARPELGLIAVVVGAGFGSVGSERRFIARSLAGLLIIAAMHVSLSFVLHVYPLPSSIFSKELQVAGRTPGTEGFLRLLVPKFGSFLLGRFRDGNIYVIAGAVALLALLLFLFAPRRVRLGFFGSLALFIAIFVRMPTNFTWYYDNCFVVLLIVVGYLGTIFLISGRRLLAATTLSVAAVFLAAVTINNWLVKPLLPWDFGRPSHAQSYVHIAARHIGNGIFVFEQFGPVHIRMCEIGIVSFLAGKSVWLSDFCGLAQPGNIASAKTSLLRFLYPGSILETGNEQLARISSQQLPILDVWALGPGPIEEARKRCHYVDDFVCIGVYRR